MINGHKKGYFLTFPLYNPSLFLFQNKIFIDSNKRPFFFGGGRLLQNSPLKRGVYSRGRLKELGRLFDLIRYLYIKLKKNLIKNKGI